MGIKNKKGQIGAFILLGLVLFIGFGFVFYLKNDEVKDTEKEISSYIDNNIQFCISGFEELKKYKK